MSDLATARFDQLSARVGGYESYYLKAGDREGRRAVWIRYTVHKRPGAAPEGSLWLTLFDRDADRPRAVKQTATHSPAPAEGGYLSVGTLGSFTPDHATGNIANQGRAASWDLRISDADAQLTHMPERLYGTPLPRTKLLTLQPQAHFSGTVEFDGEQLVLDDWLGMVGHNWGSQHAEQWVWLHGTNFEGHADDSWIDMAIGRVKLGPWTTPWIANGAICLDGVRHPLGGIGRTRAVQVTARAGRCEFTLPGEELTVTGAVSAPPEATVAWLYADPDGSQHHTLNSSVSDLELSIDGKSLKTNGGAVYEYGSRETNHSIPIEPFGDG